MTTIRILYRKPDGKFVDGSADFDPEDFAGQIPIVGDIILNPGVPQGQDRHMPQNRQIWTVVGRVFNPRDNEDYIALIVETRDGTLADEAYL